MGHRGNDGVGAASSVAGRGVVRGPRRSLRAGQGDILISLIQAGAAIFDPNKLQGPFPQSSPSDGVEVIANYDKSLIAQSLMI